MRCHVAACFHTNWLKNVFWVTGRGKGLSFLPPCHVKVNCFFLLYFPPLHHCHPDKSIPPTTLPTTPFPPSTPLCAGLEIEMREGVGGFDWLRCWDVILSKLKCVLAGWLCVCGCEKKKKNGWGNVWCSVYCIASSFVYILYLISAQTSQL